MKRWWLFLLLFPAVLAICLPSMLLREPAEVSIAARLCLHSCNTVLALIAIAGIAIVLRIASRRFRQPEVGTY